MRNNYYTYSRICGKSYEQNIFYSVYVMMVLNSNTSDLLAVISVYSFTELFSVTLSSHVPLYTPVIAYVFDGPYHTEHSCLLLTYTYIVYRCVCIFSTPRFQPIKARFQHLRKSYHSKKIKHLASKYNSRIIVTTTLIKKYRH